MFFPLFNWWWEVLGLPIMVWGSFLCCHHGLMLPLRYGRLQTSSTRWFHLIECKEWLQSNEIIRGALYNLTECLCCLLICRGWINSLSTIGKSTGAGAFMLFISLFFSVCAVLMIVMLLKVCMLIFVCEVFHYIVSDVKSFGEFRL